ncbi:expressed unknown protein [Seminavis robusta]|uniref:Uncharacterized protein n=1 Tax=Seminavis robusta TaxID=568900 RepID=A0A9N8H9F4_9STRA|nr:expressed unknown protein [Seminavis robusta]|eukprot:Sro190_g081680.1 n/a (516) ;mRNA; f:6936-8483
MTSPLRRTRPDSSVEEGPPASRRRTAQTTASTPVPTLPAQTSVGTAAAVPVQQQQPDNDDDEEALEAQDDTDEQPIIDDDDDEEQDSDFEEAFPGAAAAQAEAVEDQYEEDMSDEADDEDHTEYEQDIDQPDIDEEEDKEDSFEASSAGEEVLTGNDGEMETTTTTGPTGSQRHFREDEFVIMNASVKMMDSIVDADGPYRDKLIQLAQESIQKFNRCRSQDDTQLGPEKLVDEAWNSVEFVWAPQSNRNVQQGATAFTTMGSAGEHFFPIIAFSDSFWENDRPSRESNLDHDAILGTMMGKKTKLLFYKKLKHEFLHVIHRYLDIIHNHHFSEDGTPVKYTPWNQADTANGVPEVGDHDEEEDAGGPLLPRYNNQKLSETNPLCLQHNGAFLELNGTQVDGLLNETIYFTLVRAMRHDTGRWSCLFSRAFQHGVFAEEFYDGDTGTTNSRARRSTGTGTASRMSSPAAPRTHNLGRGGTAAWRLTGNTPIVFPESYFSRTVSRSSSPTEGLRDS